ncbi:Crp/Fnr family transcriptional regulator [Nitrobacteraceae bacterium UC4446_H13]
MLAVAPCVEAGVTHVAVIWPVSEVARQYLPLASSCCNHSSGYSAQIFIADSRKGRTYLRLVRDTVRKMSEQFEDSSIYLGKSSSHSSKSADLMCGLTAAERETVMAFGRHRRFLMGDQVFSQGEPHAGIMIILEGEVRSYYVAPSGREITLAYWTTGHFVGGPEIFGGGAHIWSGEATKDCQVLFLASDVLREAILRIPQFALNVVEALVFKAACFSSLLQFVGTRPAGKTLAHLLLILAGEQSASDNEEVVLDQRYTQEELAKMVGATRQWVATTLARMKRDRLLDVVNAKIRILNIERLRHFAEND